MTPDRSMEALSRPLSPSAPSRRVTAGCSCNSRLQRLTVERIEQTLAAETRLAAELLRQNRTHAGSSELDDEADRLGALVGVRVTFIARGRQGARRFDARTARRWRRWRTTRSGPRSPKRARRHSEVLIRRYSTTTEYDTLYAAIPIAHPAVAFVRLALPLTEIAQQQRAMSAARARRRRHRRCRSRRSWPGCSRRRWRGASTAIAEVARRYAAGDMTPADARLRRRRAGRGRARARRRVQELGRRVNELAHDRAASARDSRRHGRRRHRHRRAGPARHGQRRRARRC